MSLMESKVIFSHFTVEDREIEQHAQRPYIMLSHGDTCLTKHGPQIVLLSFITQASCNGKVAVEETQKRNKQTGFGFVANLLLILVFIKVDARMPPSEKKNMSAGTRMNKTQTLKNRICLDRKKRQIASVIA